MSFLLPLVGALFAFLSLAPPNPLDHARARGLLLDPWRFVVRVVALGPVVLFVFVV